MRSAPVSHVPDAFTGYRLQKASARAQRLSKPQDLLGADPDKQIRYLTQAAQNLQAADAAQRGGIDARA